MDVGSGMTGSVEEASVDVLAIGHAMVDVVAGVDDEFLHAEGLDKGAMHLVDADRAHSLYQRMGPGTETSGGSAANTAAGVAACGGSSAFAGTVASDQLGEIFAHDIRAAGVRYRTRPIDSKSGTGRCMVLVSPDGERTMNTYIGVGDLVSMATVDPSWLQAAAITYVEGYLLDDSHPPGTWIEAVREIHAAGRRFSVTLSDPFCVERHREKFLELIETSVDICFGNEEELCALFEVSDLDAALEMGAKRCEVVAVTLGARGSVIAAEGRRVEIPAVSTNVVDTTGAGDLYAAGVLAGLARGWDIERSGRMGSRAASAVISRLGARVSSEIRLDDDD